MPNRRRLTGWILNRCAGLPAKLDRHKQQNSQRLISQALRSSLESRSAEHHLGGVRAVRRLTGVRASAHQKW